MSRLYPLPRCFQIHFFLCKILYWIFSIYYGNTIQPESFVHNRFLREAQWKLLLILYNFSRKRIFCVWTIISYFRHLILSILLYSKLPIFPFTHPTCICITLARIIINLLWILQTNSYYQVCAPLGRGRWWVGGWVEFKLVTVLYTPVWCIQLKQMPWNKKFTFYSN